MAEPQSIDVGVIVGRFQVNKLTDGHTKLIRSVLEKHAKVIIFLGISGISPVPSTKRNPLDFEARKQMIEQAFPDSHLIISHIRDMKSDEEWSKKLDEKIRELVSPNQSVMLYGGRDSFIKYYSGKFKTEELKPSIYFSISSGKELRDKLKVKSEASDMFRAGVIWANENQYKHAIAVVDIAVFNDDYSEILLCRKEYESKYRFFGGFVDVTDESYEQTARREVQEEAGIEIGDLEYVCSAQIHDWRYNNETDKVFTTLYSTKYIFGPITPSDDIIECRWFSLNEAGSKSQYLISKLSDNIVPEHKVLFDALKIKVIDVVDTLPIYPTIYPTMSIAIKGKLT